MRSLILECDFEMRAVISKAINIPLERVVIDATDILTLRIVRNEELVDQMAAFSRSVVYASLMPITETERRVR